MNNIKRMLILLVMLCIVLAGVACGTDESPGVGETHSGEEITVTDIPSDTESQSDGETEAPTQSESQSDGETEVPTQSESQSESETEAPAQSESQSDGETEAPAQSESQSESETEAPAQSESQSESETEAPAQSESQSESETEAPAQSESQSESETEAPAQSESQSESETEKEPERPNIVSYDRTVGGIPNRYKCTGYCFDCLKINSSVFHQNAVGSSTEDVKNLELGIGDTITLEGWIGFRTQISAFGYCLGRDLNNFVELPDAKRSAENDVVEAGGEYRFSIFVDTSNLKGGTTPLLFIAVFKDGTYMIFQTIQVTIDSDVSWDGVVIPDDEIIPVDKEQVESGAELTVAPTDTENTYVTQSGLRYEISTSGVTFNSQNNRFDLSTQNFKINFPDNATAFSENFNKFKIVYSSSAPLRVTVTYIENGASVTDEVYLDEGDSQMFSCLTLGYLSGLSSKQITSLDITLLQSSRFEYFTLYDVQTEEVDVIDSGIKYIENNRYRLGIELAWGGGISYLLDKQDGNDSLSNLINKADTGRLIQQSYYGTNNSSEYQSGEYNGSMWPYNPVQGGNKYNAPSRIIDVMIDVSSVYVKAQPRDWAKTELTPSYMENIYTVYSDRIQVDNRFTDYSGYLYHRVCDQELPAFYTVAHLESFKFYNGSDGWTGGELQTESNLGFWGGNSNAYFSLKNGNAETWCAWVNESSDYGLGLYTPNIDMLLAGRHAWMDTTDPASGSCCYVAPLVRISLVSYKTIDYSYLITSGSTDEIRDLFAAHKDFADNSDLTSSDFSYQSSRRD